MPISALTPSCQCYVLASVPLDNTYRDVLDFTDAGAQSAYFISKAKYKFEDLTPIRLQNSIRLPIVADDLYFCNYIMFKNRNHSNKWFYAFITKIDYININMCEVHFEIDVMQTWQFNITVHQSYIEREHSATNDIDSSLTEDFYIGENILDTPNVAPQLSGDIQIVVASATTASGEYQGDMIYAGTPSACKYNTFTNTSSGWSSFKEFLSNYNEQNKFASIATIFTMPSEFNVGIGSPTANSINITLPKSVSKVGTYIPRNKKLLSYPYNYLLVTNGGEQSNIYRYEYFGSECTFDLYYTVAPNTTGVLVPKNYNDLNQDLTKTMTLGAFPQVAFSNDAYTQWLSLNQTSQAVKAVSSAVTIGTGIITENPAAIVGGTMGLINTGIAQDKASKQANTVSGHTDANVLVAMHRQRIYGYQCHIREDYAQIIDDYFSTYGYSVRKVKVPNTKSRPHWNYIKTQNACITGNIPFNDLAKIKSIYNNGVTFWHDDNVGAYGRNNEP